MFIQLSEKMEDVAPQLEVAIHGNTLVFTKEGVSYEVGLDYKVSVLKEESIETLTLKNLDSVVAYILKFEDPVLLYNAALCLSCEDTVVSMHRHDYVTCKCGAVSVDGGHDYTHTTVRDLASAIDLSVSSKAPHTEIRQVLLRGSRGKAGDEPLVWIKLKDISDDYLANLIIYCEQHEQYSSVHYLSYLAEVAYRK